MNLVVDIGNSRTKIGVFDRDKALFFCSSEKNPNIVALEIMEQYPLIKRIMVSSVKNTSLKAELFHKDIDMYEFTEGAKIPILNQYHTPNTLGKDRLAAAVGAFVLFPSNNSLIIDIGTCITIDFIDHENRYQGGAILLGINKKAEALHTFTEKLPLISLDKIENPPVIGKNTTESIKSGVINGSVFEICGFINYYQTHYKDLHVIVTGGDYGTFEKKLKTKVLPCQNLLLIGLNKILNINAKE